MTQFFITLNKLYKSYKSEQQTFDVLKGMSLQIRKGEFVAIMGPSGSGKSTLLNVLGILDEFDSGEYQLLGESVAALSESQAAVTRNKTFGFVFQSFNLLPFLTASENVALPLTYRNLPQKQRETLALQYLDYVGLADRAEHKPSELSGGQCQRVAIARALITEPKVLFADEPTGALDSHTSTEIMQLFTRLHQQGMTLVMVTHSDEVAVAAERIIHVRDGLIEAVGEGV